MKETLPKSAKLSQPLAKDGIRYRTLTIVPKRDFGGQPHLIKGRAVMAGFVVIDNLCCNIMPGATWFETIEEAKHAIDVLIAVRGDSDMFWEIMQPFKHTPGDRDELPGTTGTMTCGRHYAEYVDGVCVEVGIQEDK